MQKLFNSLNNIPRVRQPKQRNKEGVHGEHDGFLLNNSEIVLIDIMKADVFDEEGHNSGCKEETKSVLDTEGQFKTSSRFVLLQSGDSLQQTCQEHLIEKDYS